MKEEGEDGYRHGSAGLMMAKMPWRDYDEHGNWPFMVMWH